MTISEDQRLRTFDSEGTRSTIIERDDGRLGVLLILASAVAFSTAGFFTRLVELDVWTVLFWRGVFGGLFIASYIGRQDRGEALRAVRAIGLPGILAVCCTAPSTICFVTALR